MFTAIRMAIIALFLTPASPVIANDTVLTVSGAVSQTQEGAVWAFDMARLKELPSAQFETTTIWTTGTQNFEGVPLIALMAHVGATGNSIRAVALNDYAVTIPITDAVEGGPIVAYARNGSAMSIRDNGPLWIIYPFDGNETYKSEEYYARSIWQLDRIEIIAEE